MQAWYLLYCKRGQLQRAQEHLERQSVNCLTPVITLEKMQRGQRTTVERKCDVLGKGVDLCGGRYLKTKTMPL